ncbi:MAG: type VI secretion system tube protein Hcp [Candidatus Hinthialibacter antarcticus]|nr:type VI secretion system tube protein Hcp [Candidatus Hinthialibacter antarcticus]
MKRTPRFWKTLSAMVFGAALCLCASFDANAAAYIKFDGIDGESVDVKHEKWINILSFEHAIRYDRDQGDANPTRRGKTSLSDLTCVKELDKSSPKLAESILTNKVFPEVKIEVTKRGAGGENQAVYLTYELKNVIVTSYQFQASGDGDEPPVEVFSLNFEEIKVTYKVFDATGGANESVEYNWKVEEGVS